MSVSSTEDVRDLSTTSAFSPSHGRSVRGAAVDIDGAGPSSGCRNSRSNICSCCRLGVPPSRSPGPTFSAESYFRFSYAAAFAVNDVAMVFFFAVMTKEVVEATAPGGILRSWRRVLMPVYHIVWCGAGSSALIHLALVGPPGRTDVRH